MGNKLSSKGKQNSEASSSRGQKDQFRPSVERGMAASQWYRQHHQVIVQGSKSAILKHGGKYRASLSAAKRVIKGGYKPEQLKSQQAGGPLNKKALLQLTTPYAKSIEGREEILGQLKEKIDKLDEGIKLYHKGAMDPIHTQELESYDRDLKLLNDHWKTLPHQHEVVTSLPNPIGNAHEEKTAALDHLQLHSNELDEVLHRPKYSTPS